MLNDNRFYGLTTVVLRLQGRSETVSIGADAIDIDRCEVFPVSAGHQELRVPAKPSLGTFRQALDGLFLRPVSVEVLAFDQPFVGLHRSGLARVDSVVVLRTEAGALLIDCRCDEYPDWARPQTVVTTADPAAIHGRRAGGLVRKL